MPSVPAPLGDLSFTWVFYAAAVLGYLVGSIPFGLILTRAAGLGDIRTMGSGNIGATNVLRTGNKLLGALTLFLDGGKGALAVAAAMMTGGLELAWFAGLGAVIGHMFPIWLRLRGGKGVATTLGVELAIAPLVGLIACATWLVVAALARYSSLAALFAVLAAPIAAFVWAGNSHVTGLALILAVLVWLRHGANIRRLVRGEESRIGRRG